MNIDDKQTANLVPAVSRCFCSGSLKKTRCKTKLRNCSLCAR